MKLRLLAILSVCLFSFASIQAQKVYWSNTSSGSIYRANLDGSDMELILDESGLAIRDVQIYQQGNRLYYGTTGKRLKVCELDGSNPSTLLSGANCGEPIDIDIDIKGGKIYWTSQNPDGVWRANLNGTNPVQLIATGGYAYALSLDLEGGKLYWTGAGGLQRANLDGSGVETVYTGGVLTGVEYDPNSDKIYVARFLPKEIIRINPDGSGNELMYATAQRPYRLEINEDTDELYWSTQFAKIEKADLETFTVVDVATTGDPGGIAFLPPPPIPTMGQWAMMIFGLISLTLAVVFMYNKQLKFAA